MPAERSQLPDASPSGPAEEFVRQFTSVQRRLYLHILSQVPSPLDAEEILQEANCVMLTKHTQFASGSNFVAWATQIVAFEILKYRQRYSREKLRFSDEFLQAVVAESPRTLDTLEERRRALEICLEKLRPEDRRLIQSRYRLGTTAYELAQSIGRPANSVYQSLGRIRRALLECVERQLAADGAA